MAKEHFSRSVGFNHLMALFVVMVWGTTFVSTKILLIEGLTASQIMVYRFLVAYLLMLPFTRRFRADSLRDEGLLMLAGIFGGSLYFFTENLALNYTMVTNVSLIVCFTPIITLILTRIFFKSVKITRYATIGSIISLVGVALVIFNGSYILKLNPIGDLLTFIAALSWGGYSILIKVLQRRYSALFITRKVFFYGVATLLPVTLSQSEAINLELLLEPTILTNLLFLAILASFICFILWTRLVCILGAATANNYIYLQPLAALVTSYIILGEPITIIAAVGAIFILFGLLFVERGERLTHRLRNGLNSISKLFLD